MILRSYPEKSVRRSDVAVVYMAIPETPADAPNGAGAFQKCILPEISRALFDVIP